MHFVFKGEGTAAAPRRRGRSTERGRGRTPFFWGIKQCKPMHLWQFCRDLAFKIVHLIVWRVCVDVICHLIGGEQHQTSPIFCHQKSSISTSSAPVFHRRLRRWYESQSIGRRVRCCWFEGHGSGRYITTHHGSLGCNVKNIAKGGGVRWWHRWLGKYLGYGCIYLCICLSIYLSICLSIYLSSYW